MAEKQAGSCSVPQRWLMGKMDAFRRQCREAGLRVTPQRLAVYEVLLKSDDHPSAEMVCRRVREDFPTISLDTVNRTLLTLYDMGVAVIVEGSGGPKRFDGDLSDHRHFKCMKCDRVVDLCAEGHVDVEVPPGLESFTVLRKTAYYEGICDLCQSGHKLRKAGY